ncbi:hypothetical protein [Chitinophaga varians]|uniref:hypothetical protein n=1 Tax=Chitinophaga varians TaxID=2202339 RepID=UPI001CB6CB22|nr:hypothetical protein [Chitinophaga varians]
MQEAPVFVWKSESILNHVAFKEFVWKDRFNRTLIYSCAIAVVLQLCVFIYLFPVAFFINADSYQYLISASQNRLIDIYPIGYPKFLRLFSVFSSSAVCLVVFQYVFVQTGIVLLLFTLYYFLALPKWVKISLLVCMVLNPIFLFMANYVSSDALFLGLSIYWILILIWILNRPSWRLIIGHAVVIALAFIVRYSALFYPAVSLVIFLLCNAGIRQKITGVFLMAILIGVFIGMTGIQYKKITGEFQFSPFSGWQLANNAIYAYKFVRKENRRDLPPKFKDLDKDVRNYIDSTRDLARFPMETLRANTFYMWIPNSPLRIYMNHGLKADSSDAENFRRWAKVGPLYGEYGREIIKAYPEVFLGTFAKTNFIKYYSPPVEFLGLYGFSNDTIPGIAKSWFGYSKSDDKIIGEYSKKTVRLFSFFPIVWGVMIALFVVMSTSFVFLGVKKDDRMLYNIWILFTTYLLCNIVFSVFASAIALRFQIFSLILCISMNFLILSYMLKKGREMDSRKVVYMNY